MMKTTNKVLLAGSTAIGLALTTAPAFAQVTIDGDAIAVFDGVDGDQANAGGGVDLNGGFIFDGTGQAIQITDTEGLNFVNAGADITGVTDVTASGIVTADGGVVTNGADISLGGGDLLGANSVNATTGNFGAGGINVTTTGDVTLADGSFSTANGDVTAANGTVSGNTLSAGAGGLTTSGGLNVTGGNIVVAPGTTISTGVFGFDDVIVDDDLDVNGTFNVDGLTTTAGITNTGDLTSTGNTALGTDAGTTNSFGTGDNSTVTIGGGVASTTAVGNGANASNTFGIGANSTNVLGSATSTNTINGATTFNQATTFVGDASFGNIGSTGLITANDLTVNGTLTIAGDLDVGSANNSNNSIGSGLNSTNTIGAADYSSTNLIQGQTTIQNETSYVTVNPDSVVLHGGTTSTTVTVSNAGVTVVDTTNGQTFAVSNTGNATLLGTLTAGGVNTGATGNIVAGNGIAASAGQNAIVTGVTIDAVTQRITGVANGVVSATSNDVVTGQQLFATNQQIAGFNAGLVAVNNRVDLLSNRVDKAYQGVAMGFAMNAAPISLANGEGGISGGVGYFQGEVAGAVKAQYVTDSGVGLGINVGFSSDAVGGGVGASIKF